MSRARSAEPAVDRSFAANVLGTLAQTIADRAAANARLAVRHGAHGPAALVTLLDVESTVRVIGASKVARPPAWLPWTDGVSSIVALVALILFCSAALAYIAMRLFRPEQRA